jgi:pre-mRNA-splicing factor ISY1
MMVRETGINRIVEVAMPRSRKDMYKNIDADYYGFRDEEDGKLAVYEEEFGKAEMERVDAVVREQMNGKSVAEMILGDPRISDEATECLIPNYPKIPTQKEVEESLVERTRQSLLNKFAS